MDIKIFGPGCVKCGLLEKNVKEALSEVNIKDINLEKVSEIDKIVEEGILGVPALMINGDIKSTGRVPSTQEIKNWIDE